MDRDLNRRRRRSLRLAGYDYAQAGAYFVTLNVQDRATILGAVVDGVIQFSEIGKIVAEEWEQTPTIRPDIRLDAHVVRRVGAPIWQRNYYEHIIRSDEDLERIRRYIAENPARWAASQELP